MAYRTKTYIAGAWTEDKNAVEALHKWNNNDYWGLNFSDAHDLTQARDSSLNCNIKRSLKGRLDLSKTFVLIVSDATKKVRNGSCQYCSFYISPTSSCSKGYSTSLASYVDYECSVAFSEIPKIVVLYNSTTVDKSKCPEVLKTKGSHVAMHKRENGELKWDYQAIKNAIMG